jgi:AcrR family transcriptional regulator
MNVAIPALTPRKSPLQARALATIDALHVAAIQVLTREGLARCTTTRVAERAGTSVGTLYQYYPNRDALLAAVLEAHLVDLADTMDDVCGQQRGKPLSEMAVALVATFLDIKLRDPQASQALYAIAAERGGAELVSRINARMVAAVSAMLDSSPEARFDDPDLVAAVALNAIVGNVRAVLEDYAPPDFETRMKEQLILLLCAYLRAS